MSDGPLLARIFNMSGVRYVALADSRPFSAKVKRHGGPHRMIHDALNKGAFVGVVLSPFRE